LNIERDADALGRMAQDEAKEFARLLAHASATINDR
jgi:hypothetical protein